MGALSPLINSAQHVKGTIEDAIGNRIGFVSVYEPTTKAGTTANEQGKFDLTLDSGTFTIQFSIIGYKPTQRVVTLKKDETKQLNIVLEEQAYEINEVRVGTHKEDPAYAIIRHAIAHRQLYLNEPKAYQCRTYIKGMQRITDVPKRVLLMKVPEDIEPGIVYLSESVSELFVQKPNLVKEKLISSKVSGDNKAFSFNRAGSIRFNLYENMLPSYGLNQRGFVSPIANNALMYYDYKLEGESRDGKYTIFKIKLLPKRKHDPAFRGHIYVIKDLWRVHSSDLMLDKTNNIDFVDQIRIRQEYKQLENGVWMPTVQRFNFNLEILGFKGDGYFIALYSNYKVQSAYKSEFYGLKDEKAAYDPPLGDGKKQKAVVKKLKATSEQPIDENPLFDPKFFNREILGIDEKANKVPDTVWESLRPIPLTEEEQIDYRTSDSIEQFTATKEYKDSVDRISNKYRWNNLYLNEYTYVDSYRKIQYTIKPLPSVLQFNTVEGWVIQPYVKIEKILEENKRKWVITPELRLGFSSQTLYPKLRAEYHYNEPLLRKLHVEGGNYVSQFNQNEPISPTLNSLYSLFNRQNFMRLYAHRYIRLGAQSEVINGITLTYETQYANRSPLQNVTNYSLNNRTANNYELNLPIQMGMPISFEQHRAWTHKFQADFVFAQRYINRPDMRIRFRSKYPTLSLEYEAARAIAGTQVNFDKVQIGTKWQRSLKLYGYFRIEAYTGTFIQSATTYIMDAKHFGGNRTLYGLNNFNGFQLLDYYAYSTTQAYAALHARHHFNGFWLNKVPLLRKLKWQEVISYNKLYTQQAGAYAELGVGIEHIFKIVRVDYYRATGIYNPINQGIRIGFGF
jgi:hypothetical protein